MHINLTKRFFIFCCFHVALAYYKLECLLTWKKLVFTFFHHEIVLSFFFYITVWRNVLRLCCWSTNAWNYVSFQCQWINIQVFWWDFLFYFALFWFTLIDLEILLRSPGCWVDWIKVKILNLILRHHSSIPGHGLQVQL